MNGEQYRVKAERADRPGVPLSILEKRDGKVICRASAGDSCARIPADVLKKWIALGLVEPIDGAKPRGKRAE